MRTALAIAGKSTNRGGARLDTRKARSDSIQPTLMELAKELSSGKTWGYLADLLHLKEDVAKHRVANRRTLKPDEIAALLRSDEGIHYLVAIMGDARPKWWQTLLRMGVLGGIERRREADLQLLRKVANVSDQTSAELPAALMVQDPEFYSPVFEALDAVARRPGGAVGSKGGRR